MSVPRRRSLLKGSGLALLDSGFLSRVDRVAALQKTPSLTSQHGCGFNWSDTVVVGKKSGYRMSRVPYSKEWCWIKI